MQKRSHLLLAAALLRTEGGFSHRNFERAFLTGSVQPDCNPFSYLKGSVHAQTLGGHTYANARTYIHVHIRALQNSADWNLWQYYTLGKLTHYLADAFTYPHNAGFPERGWAHHRYETKLRFALAAYLATHAPEHRSPPLDLPSELEALHEQYLAEPHGVDHDIRYILYANELLMAGCPAPVSVVNFA